jgi:hypothetical protein
MSECGRCKQHKFGKVEFCDSCGRGFQRDIDLQILERKYDALKKELENLKKDGDNLRRNVELMQQGIQ